MKIKILLPLLAAAAVSFPSLAVTDKEMDQAKVIAAQLYLRWANDGSGYLDAIKPTSMADLESKLKPKEKENIKAFKSVKIPSDYASWDKTKLTEFWGVTFFTSPALDAGGKRAKDRVKAKISAMTIAAPSAKKEEPKAEPAPVETAEQPAATQTAPTVQQPAQDLPTAEEAVEKTEEILADQNAIAKDAEEKQYQEESSGTWGYVIALVLLLGAVVWLVVYAANMMKKQPSGEGDETGKGAANEAELRQQFTKAMGKKNDELSQISANLAASEKENSRLMDIIEDLKQQNASLKAEVAALNQRAAQRPAAPQPAVRPEATQAPEAGRNAEAAKSTAAKAMPNTIYLGRANARGLFVRADRRLNPGHTIYRLDSRDGLVGTFKVIDLPEVTDIALENPVQYLAGGCTAIDIEDTAGATSIVTENAGTAIFEDGCWKVLRKSRIRYE